MSFDTFDTDASVTSGITFTGGGLTAADGSTHFITASRIAQAIEGKTSGKWYVEFTCNAFSGADPSGCGVVYSIGVGGGQFIGNLPGGVSADQGWGYYENSVVKGAGSTQTAVNNATYTTGDVIGVAIDLTNKRIWFRKNTGSWVGTSGSPDPATNTNGFTLAYTAGQHVFPAANLSGNGAKYTANFGASAFTGTVPSGFTSGWTSTANSTGYFGAFTTNGFGGYLQTPAQNNVMVSQYVSNFSGVVSSVVIPFASSVYSDLKCVIYADNGSSAPGSLLAVSTALVTGGPGELTFTFGSPPTLVNGTTYYIGVISDAASGLGTNHVEQPATTTTKTWAVADTYASPAGTFPGSPTTSSFRIPLKVFAPTSSTETGTAILAFSGLSFVAAGTDRHTGTGTLAFSGISLSGVGSRTHVKGTGTLAFSGLSFTAAGSRIHVKGTGVLSFVGVKYAVTGSVTHVKGTAALSFGAFAIAANGSDIVSPIPPAPPPAPTVAKQKLAPWAWNVPIVNDKGYPSAEFMRKFDSQNTVNESVVPQNYIDVQDAAQLAAGQGYTVTYGATVLVAAKAYTDSQPPNALPEYTVATLPVGATVGKQAIVTDALTPTYLAPVVGLGAVTAPVLWDGTNWVCH